MACSSASAWAIAALRRLDGLGGGWDEEAEEEAEGREAAAWCEAAALRDAEAGGGCSKVTPLATLATYAAGEGTGGCRIARLMILIEDVFDGCCCCCCGGGGGSCCAWLEPPTPSLLQEALLASLPLGGALGCAAVALAAATAAAAAA